MIKIVQVKSVSSDEKENEGLFSLPSCYTSIPYNYTNEQILNIHTTVKITNCPIDRQKVNDKSLAD